MTARMLPPSGVPLSLADLWAGVSALAVGPRAVACFRDDICRRFGAEHCFLVSSGRAALSILFRALHRLHPDRSVVALPAYTSFSVASAAVHAGFKVSLYDLDRDTLSPDPESVRQAVGPETLCVVACHLFGYPCDTDEIAGIAGEFGVPLVDDAAQAMGATLRGNAAGTSGIAGIFSLSRGKNISTVDGGIIITQSAALADAIGELPCSEVRWSETAGIFVKAAILSLFQRPALYGIPARMPQLNIGASIFDPRFPVGEFSPFQAGLGRLMLARLDRLNRERCRVAEEMMQRLAGRVRFFVPVNGARPVYPRLPFIPLEGRAAPSAPSLGVVPSYPEPLDRLPGLRPHLARETSCPAAAMLAQNIRTIPTHCFVTSPDLDHIVRVLSGTGGAP